MCKRAVSFGAEPRRQGLEQLGFFDGDMFLELAAQDGEQRQPIVIVGRERAEAIEDPFDRSTPVTEVCRSGGAPATRGVTRAEHAFFRIDMRDPALLEPRDELDAWRTIDVGRRQSIEESVQDIVVLREEREHVVHRWSHHDER